MESSGDLFNTQLMNTCTGQAPPSRTAANTHRLTVFTRDNVSESSRGQSTRLTSTFPGEQAHGLQCASSSLLRARKRAAVTARPCSKHSATGTPPSPPPSRCVQVTGELGSHRACLWTLCLASRVHRSDHQLCDLPLPSKQRGMYKGLGKTWRPTSEGDFTMLSPPSQPGNELLGSLAGFLLATLP